VLARKPLGAAFRRVKSTVQLSTKKEGELRKAISNVETRTYVETKTYVARTPSSALFIDPIYSAWSAMNRGFVISTTRRPSEAREEGGGISKPAQRHR
jgi:hypothetical protein